MYSGCNTTYHQDLKHENTSREPVGKECGYAIVNRIME